MPYATYIPPKAIENDYSTYIPSKAIINEHRRSKL